MTNQIKKKSNFFNDLKNWKNLTKKKKKGLVSDIVLYLSIAIMIPLMVAHIVLMFADGGKIGMPFWFLWFSFALCSFITWGCGYTFFIKAYKEIFKWRRPGMSTLVTVASLVAYFYSFYPLITNTISYANNGHDHQMDFFDTSAMIVVIIKFGESITGKLKLRTNDDLEAVAALQVSSALLYDPITDTSKEIDTKDIKVGDFLLVKKGSRVPIDGVVFKGETDVDESMLTGESKPIHKSINSKVIGATNNLTSTFIMQATVVGKNTVVNSIISNVKKISSQKPRYQMIADKISMWFTPVVITLALLAFFLQAFVPHIQDIGGTFSTWFGEHSVDNVDKWSRAVFYAVGTLSIACPCALGLAAPLATLVGASKAARNGIIINRADAYEKIKKIDAVAFDKTGTLTEGKFTVSKIIGNQENLVLINQLEKKSIHPLALSFTKYIEENFNHLNDNVLETEIQEVPGVGMKMQWQDKTYEVTSYHYAKQNGYLLNEEVKEFLLNYGTNKEMDVMQSIVCFSINNEVVNVIVFEDKIADNAYDVVNLLHSMNIDVYMISGDNEVAVKFVANKLGIKHYYANVKPSEKSNIIKQIQDQNKVVAFVGDGINDLEALKQSDLSIAINKDNSIANSISDILILNHDILSVVKSISITKVTRRMIIFNLIWAFAYNVITLPLSILGFIPAFIGVFIMASSDLTVIGNTLFFKMRKTRFISKKQEKLLINKNISPYL